MSCCSKVDRDSFDEYSGEELSAWLISQQSTTQSGFTVCPTDVKSEKREDDQVPIIASADKCGPGQRSKWTGKWSEKTGLPKGPGSLHEMEKNLHDKNMKTIESSELSQRLCLDLFQGVEKFSGSFSSKGEISGNAKISYQFDETLLEGQTAHGAFDGRVKMIDRQGKVRMVGIYRGGRPHGPAWIFPFDNKDKKEPAAAVLHVHFEKGKLVEYPVIVLKRTTASKLDSPPLFVGKLINDSIIGDVAEFTPKLMGDVNCVKVLDISTLKGKNDDDVIPPLKSPVAIKAFPQEGRVYLRPGKTLIFNRIAKTGSQSIIELLVQLKHKNGIEPLIQLKQVEHLMEPPKLISEFIGTVDRATRALAVIRHYNFVDFEEYGGIFTPTYINVVRNPVDKIVSWFYYWRAAWNVVERKMAYPNEPLPDPEFLRKDFDSCVLSGDPECQYVPGSSVLSHNDHRSQIMQFCGHEFYCAEFNGERAFNKAKENVEKFYPVVGVLEDMNKTLKVFEAKLPEVN